MNKAKTGHSGTHPSLSKAATGIQGLDEITGGVSGVNYFFR
jgi:hypothetical protein